MNLIVAGIMIIAFVILCYFAVIGEKVDVERLNKYYKETIYPDYRLKKYMDRVTTKPFWRIAIIFSLLGSLFLSAILVSIYQQVRFMTVFAITLCVMFLVCYFLMAYDHNHIITNQYIYD